MSVRDRRCISVYVPEWGPSAVWTYWSHFNDLQLNEWVVVEDPHRPGFPLVGKVKNLTPPRQSCAKAKKWIVDRTDWDKYRALQALAPAEPEIVE